MAERGPGGLRWKPGRTRDTRGVAERVWHICLQGAKYLDALGWLVRKEVEEGLHGEGRQWVGMMIDAPPGKSSVLVFILIVRMPRTIRLKASHDVAGRRVDIGLGKGPRRAARGGGRGMGAGRRGADVAMGRGGGESNNVVGEEKREGVGEGSCGQGAGVPFRVEVVEEKGGTDGGWRQAEDG